MAASSLRKAASSLRKVVLRHPSGFARVCCALTVLLAISPRVLADYAGDSVWVAESASVVELAASGGDLLLTLPTAVPVRAVGVDAVGGRVWFYADGTLHAITLDGDPILSQPIPATAGSSASIEVDRTDGAVWLGVGTQLWKFSPSGVELATAPLYSAVRELEIDLTRQALWVATETGIEVLDSHSGVPVDWWFSLAGVTPLGQTSPSAVPVTDISLAPSTGDLYELANDTLQRLIAVPEESITAVQYMMPAPGGQFVAARDDGTYMATSDTLHRVSSEGALLWTLMPFPNGVVKALAVDRSDGSAWLATAIQIAQISPEGVLLQLFSLPPASDIRDLDLFVDLVPPELAILQPNEGALLNSRRPVFVLSLVDAGSGVDLGSISFQANGLPVGSVCTETAVGADCLPTSDLTEGETAVSITATDRSGNASAPGTISFSIDSIPPAPVEMSLVQLEVISPENVRLTGSQGSTDVEAAGVRADHVVSGATASTSTSPDGGFVLAIAAAAGSSIELRAFDQAGNLSSGRIVEVPGSMGTPDPASTAPPLDPSVPTDFAAATSFLYDAANPVQRGVEAGTLEPRRVAVVRGRVSERDGTPLTDVTVRVLAHPELGSTTTRTDGMFDLAVNGGGTLTIVYEKDGYPPIHRTIAAPWRDYVWAKDVVMIRYDSASTVVVSGSAETQVAQGSLIEDEDGLRRATLVFPAGTSPRFVLADGSIVFPSELTVRATEYTVGPEGPRAMPAELPVASSYTYAIELSVDEAVQASARRVEFGQPIYVYVDNFLEFPIGGIVPAGYFDDEASIWRPADNGRVVRILGVSDGRALVDVDGSGNPASAELLSGLGFTDGELERIGELYDTNRSLWRIPIPHFTPWDFNWPGAAPPDAILPPDPDAEQPLNDDPLNPDELSYPENPERNPNDQPQTDQDQPCQQLGSIIDCDNQVLGETVLAAGTPYRLNYRSSRVPGRKVANVVDLRLSGSQVPASLERIDVVIEVAGRRFHHSFAPSPNVRYMFEWDGLDAYGREVRGPARLTGTVTYVYPIQFTEPAPAVQAFGRFSPTSVIIGNRGRSSFSVTKTIPPRFVGVWDARGVGLGGWSLDPHHVFDPASRTLYLGDGRRQSVRQIANGLAWGGPLFGSDHRVADWRADGAIVTAENLRGRDRLWVHRPDGTLSAPHDTPNGQVFSDVVAGHGKDEFYYSTTGCGPTNPGFVRRVFSVGVFQTETLLTWPEVTCPQGLAVAPDGSLYINDHTRILRYWRDGRLDVVLEGTRGGGFPAGRLAIASDGAVVFAEPSLNRIRHLGADGRVTTVAGTGERGFSGDGGLASEARLNNPIGVAFDGDGRLLIGDSGNNRLRRVSLGGIIETIAGTGQLNHVTPSAPGTPALAAVLNAPGDVAVAADGTIYIATQSDVRPIRPPLPGYKDAGYTLASADGREAFVFDESGRHLRTVSALDGSALLELEYDGAGSLTGVLDASGNRTRIERDAAGDARAIVAPGGARTELSVGPEGFLEGVTAPDGGVASMQYGAGGLLSHLQTPNGSVQTFQYSSRGRLLHERDQSGQAKSLARTIGSQGSTVDVTTAQGRTGRFELVRSTDGTTIRTLTSPSALTTTIHEGRDGRVEVSEPDGTHLIRQRGPDPRWGMAAPINKRLEWSYPSGLKYVLELDRSAFLRNAADPLSLGRLTDTWRENGRLSTSVYEPTTRQFVFTSPQGRRTTTTIDLLARPVLVQRLGFEPLSFVYGTRGELAEVHEGAVGSPRITRYSYDPSGFVTGISDPLARTATLERDAVGRVSRQLLPNGDAILFTYDSGGLLASIEPPGKPPHGLTHDDNGRLVGYDPPSDPAVADQTHFGYNLDGQLTTITPPSGRGINLSYAASGQLETIGIPEGVYRYHSDVSTGRLTRVEAPGGSMLQMEYDGSLLTASTWSGEVAGRVERTYDANLWVAQSNVNGIGIANVRDLDGLLTQVGNLIVTRDTDTGRVGGTALGVVSTSSNHDGFGEVESLTAKVSGADIFSQSFQRDGIGRIVSKTERVGLSTSTYSYEYDLLGRLISVWRDGLLWASYGYDRNGNRIGYDGPFGSYTATYDDRDQIVEASDSTFLFGPDGDLVSRSQGIASVVYGHDALGHLRSVQLSDGRTIEYLLDGANRRIGKKINGVLSTSWLYDGPLNVVAELDGAGNLISRFVYATRGNVPDYLLRGGRSYRIITDHLGSPRLVIDAVDGTVIQELNYDEFGRVTLDTNPGFQPFGFAGGLYDLDTGFVHFGSREYDPHWGRWTTLDPVLFAGLDTNLYAYVGNDPVNFVDPLGWIKLPADPTGLPPEWTHDPTHRDPYGRRYRHPNGDVLDYHKGRPDQPRWRGRDHWHHNGGEDHLRPGDEIPDPAPEGVPGNEPAEFCRPIDVTVESPIPDWLAIGLGVGIIVATLVEDVATAGVGIVDDPATLGFGAVLIGTSVTIGPAPGRGSGGGAW